MASSSAVDDSREEHRMLMRLNDIDPIMAKLIIGEEHGDIRNKEGMLKQKVHAMPYTITLYAMLKDYGMTPVNRVKPRVRLCRNGPYDNFASFSPILFPDDASVNLVEFKYRNENPELVDPQLLQRIFSDGPICKNMASDPAALLVAQHDLFLMQPPVKNKSKIEKQESGKEGIPLGEFLEALNNPAKTVKIFSKYQYGKQFAKALMTTLEPFMGLEFEFGIYSRYKRRDCVFVDKQGKSDSSYRTTFDPTTVLGWIRNTDFGQQLQPLVTEKSGRWEHKVNPDGLEEKVLRRISKEIRNARHDYLIPRCLSKSQTALTLLGEYRESGLNLADELATTLTLEMSLKTNKYSDIDQRKKLRAMFNRDNNYILHPSTNGIVEKHLNLAVGQKGDMNYVLNNVNMSVRQMPFETKHGGVKIIQQPKFKEEPVLSATDLRDKLPRTGFDSCHSMDIHECGYVIVSQETGRCYNVGFGRRQKGSIGFHAVSTDKPEHFLSVKYLGITPDRFSGVFATTGKGLYLPKQYIQKDIVREMKDIVEYMKHRDFV